MSVSDHLSSLTGSGSTSDGHTDTKLASLISVFSVYNCTPLKTLSSLSLLLSLKYSTSE
jgi:hypothetical protein